MTYSPFLTLFLTGLAIGGYRVGRNSYKEWKAKRALLPADVRNGGFVTDTKLAAFEWTLRGLIAVYVLWIAYLLFFIVAGDQGWIDWARWPMPF